MANILEFTCVVMEEKSYCLELNTDAFKFKQRVDSRNVNANQHQPKRNKRNNKLDVNL